jgi:hypothetical protein
MLKTKCLCLGTLFEFRFADVRNLLRDWDASDHWAIVKAGLESHLDTDAAKKRLRDANARLVQEKLLGIELQLVLAGFGREQRLQEMYKQMEYDGLKHLSGMIETLLRDVNPGKERIEARGYNKFISGDGLHLTNVSKERSSLQILGLLMESGFPLSTSKTTLYSYKEMFPAIVASIPFYPVPVLFFAIQYDDISFLKRIGQEYAYEQKVDFYHERILRCLSETYSSAETPARIKINSLFFLCEFIIAVSNELWEGLLTIVWGESYTTLTPLTDSRTASMQFIAKSLPLVQNLNIGRVILTDCLSMTGVDTVPAMIRCSYYLQLNPYFREHALAIRQGLSDDLFANLVKSAQSDHNYLIVIGNLSVFLGDNDKIRVISFLNNLDFTSIEPVLYEVILSLLDGNDLAIREKLVGSLERNPALWRTGLSDSRPGVFGPAPFIKLQVLRNQMAWTKLNANQVVGMYQRMSDELRKISNFMTKGSIDGLVNFRSNLQEMLWFLEDEEMSLKNQPDFEQIRSTVNELFLKNMYGVNDMDALLSNDLVSINWVILRVSRDIIDCHKVLENDNKIRQVIARISMKNPIGLESCIYHLVNWFYDLRQTDHMKIYLSDGIILLNRYISGSYTDSCEVSLIEEKLIQLAYVFRSWRNHSNVVNTFCEMLESSRYNNVRYRLKSRLKDDGMLK